jgi:hypothetical protein
MLFFVLLEPSQSIDLCVFRVHRGGHRLFFLKKEILSSVSKYAFVVPSGSLFTQPCRSHICRRLFLELFDEYAVRKIG